MKFHVICVTSDKVTQMTRSWYRNAKVGRESEYNYSATVFHNLAAGPRRPALVWRARFEVIDAREIHVVARPVQAA